MSAEVTDQIDPEALGAFLAIVGQILRETSALQLDVRRDPKIVPDRLRYLVQQRCQPWQPEPLSDAQVLQVKKFHAILNLILESPDGPLKPYN